jgi:hypothetical protein
MTPKVKLDDMTATPDQDTYGLFVDLTRKEKLFLKTALKAFRATVADGLTPDLNAALIRVQKGLGS